jgi:hypothetical protein
MVGQDGRTYEAASLFDAVDRALQQWARRWWYRPGAVVERIRVWRSQPRRSK